MAAGDLIGAITGISPPVSNRASLGNFLCGTTSDPADGENIQTVDYDDTTDEYYDYIGLFRGWGGSNDVEVHVPIINVGTSGNIVLGGAFRRLNSPTEDLDTDHSYSYQSVTYAVPTGSANIYSIAVITFTSSQIDSLAAGEEFVWRMFRDADNASDTMTGDARIIWHLIKLIEATP